MADVSFTSIDELGEFGLIDRLTKALEINNKSTLMSVGDDCAIVSYPDKNILLSSDMMVSNVHFDLLYTPLQHLGYKAVIQSISDIYAMNGIAEQIIVSVAFSNKFSVEMADLLYEGIKAACNQYEVDLAGGDTTTILNGLVINVTAIGSAAPEMICYRHGAVKNDILCVSGDLGAAYLGLLLLEREKMVYLTDNQMQPILEGHDYILRRQLRPEARKDMVLMLKDIGIKPTSMIDISDGLSSEILHIAKSSNVGVKLFEDKIPIDPTAFKTARDFNLDPVTAALSGGEDYELLFTIKTEDYEKIKNNPDITAIGHITDQDYGCKLITKSGSETEIKAQGWKVFNKEKKGHA